MAQTRILQTIALVAATLAIAIAITQMGRTTSAFAVAVVIVVFAIFVVLGGSLVSRNRTERARVTTTLAVTPVREAMSRCRRSVAPDDRLEIAAERLVADGLRQIPIVEHGKPVGVLTRDDVAAGLACAGADALVADAPHHPAIVVSPADPLSRVVDRLRGLPDAVVVVAEHGRSVGMVTRDSISMFAMTHTRPSPVY